MHTSLYTAYSGMRAQMNALEVVSNNLANVNTDGFKEHRTFFTMLAGASGESSPNVTAGQSINNSEGPLSRTGRDLDVALAGPGYLVVETPRGLRYSRNGSLSLDGSSVLVNKDGYPVLGDKGRITLGPGRVTISREGRVALEGRPVDRIRQAAFGETEELAAEGGTLFAPRSAAAKPRESSAEVRQGYLENSNVNAVGSVVALVAIMRQFEAVQKTVNLLMNDINGKAIERLAR